MKKLTIESIRLEGNQVQCSLLIGKNRELLITNINETCLPFLCIDRVDAYVVGFLYFAMKNGYDFYSEIPISSELYYSIKKHYIPGLRLGNSELHDVEIIAPFSDFHPTKEKNIIGTGISCGVDSLYTIQVNTSDDIPRSCKLNGLFFFNVGAGFKGEKTLRTPLIEGRMEMAERFSKEYGFAYYFIESNIHLIMHKYVPYDHLEMESFVALFCIYTLQNGIKSYHFSSSNSVKDFSIDGDVVKNEGTCMFDMFTYSCLSINGMMFNSEGAEVERLDKVRSLCCYPPAYKYLNVCFNELHNCGICAKCIRTLLEINAVGDIDQFMDVFDVHFFKKHYKTYLRRLFINAKMKNEFYSKKIYPYYANQISIWDKMKWILAIILNKFVHKHVEV